MQIRVLDNTGASEMSDKMTLYLILTLAVWIGGIYAVTDSFMIALIFPGIFVGLGIAGKFGSQALNDWLRGRNQRQQEELIMKIKERDDASRGQQNDG